MKNRARASRGQVHRRHAGFGVVYVAVLLVVLLGIASLAVDFGRVQLCKTELQSAADSAARAGANVLAAGDSQARAAAVAIAAANRVDGAALALQNGDIQTGNWSGSAFVSGGTPINAIRVVALRSASRGNAVPLFLASIMGQGSCDVQASAIALATPGDPNGFIGLDGISFKNNAYVGSYRSSVTTSPTSANSTGNGGLSSNGEIEFKNNAVVDGNLVLGPGGNVDFHNNLSVSGATINLASPITVPASPSWSPGTNPAGVPQNYSVNSNTTLPGGTYWFTSLTSKKKLTFSGAATINLNGDADLDDDIVTHDSKPSNLKIYQLGNNRTFELKNNTKLIAQIHAPGSNLIANNKLYLYGSAVFKTIDCKNSAEFFLDEDSPNSSGGTSVTALSLVK